MDEKKEKCKRCGVNIEPKTKRAEFCSPKCKVYWHRENPKIKPPIINYTPPPIFTSKENIEKFNQVFKEVGQKPRNLMELKSMCPPELSGFEKSEWIATERQKYGI